MNSISLAERYRNFTRLREAVAPPWNEEWVQRLWFEQLTRNPLKDRQGRTVEILQSGLWNKGAGPDFLHAALRADGELRCGDLEIHLKGEDWQAHGHDRDPHYNGVMAHLVWEASGPGGEARTREGRTLPEIVLSGQLAAPLEALASLFTSTAYEQEVGARAGACRRELAAMAPGEQVELLVEAGRHRFARRVRLWAARGHQWGREQALWMGLADALGYSRNRAPFRNLAQRLDLESLRRISDPLAREALLYGQAGFLPEASLPAGPAGDWAARLWEHWWKWRAQMEIPPVRGWELRGARPANRPERRLAVLSLVSDPKTWRRLVSLCQSGETAALTAFFQELRHPYWDDHASLGGARMARPMALMGRSRVESFLFNVVWPLAVASGNTAVWRQVEAEKTGESMLPARIAAVRLLGSTARREARRVLVQEGLIQIYQDFCLREFDACRQCEFPELVARFKNA